MTNITNELTINDRNGVEEDAWNEMVITAANSRKIGDPKNICIAVNSTGICTLKLETDQGIKQHLKQYGSWSYEKMSLRTIINITRISSLNKPSSVKPELKESILFFATQAEKKYTNGLIGSIRNAVSAFFNFFARDSVWLCSESKVNCFVKIRTSTNKGKLPLFIGNTAKFARLIAKDL